MSTPPETLLAERDKPPSFCPKRGRAAWCGRRGRPPVLETIKRRYFIFVCFRRKLFGSLQLVCPHGVLCESCPWLGDWNSLVGTLALGHSCPHPSGSSGFRKQLSPALWTMTGTTFSAQPWGPTTCPALRWGLGPPRSARRRDSETASERAFSITVTSDKGRGEHAAERTHQRAPCLVAECRGGFREEVAPQHHTEGQAKSREPEELSRGTWGGGA